jgi:hypothetical protein
VRCICALHASMHYVLCFRTQCVSRLYIMRFLSLSNLCCVLCEMHACFHFPSWHDVPCSFRILCASSIYAWSLFYIICWPSSYGACMRPLDTKISFLFRASHVTTFALLHRWPFQIFDDERIMRLMGLCEPRIAPQLQFHDTATDATIARSAHTHERPDVHDNRHQRQEEEVEEERENDEDQHQQHQHPVAQQPPLGAHLSEKAALRQRASLCAGLITTPAKHPRGDSKAATGSQDEHQQQTVKVSPSAGVDAMGLTSRKDEERSKEANGLRY